MDFYMPVKVYTGNQCVEKHKEELRRFGGKCLIVTGRSSAKKCGALDDVTSALNSIGTEWSVFDTVGPNPALSDCMEAGIVADRYNADFIVGIGGGSAMDAAKAAAVFAVNPDLDEKRFYNKDWNREPLPIVLVGTTAGTGSEVTDVSVLTDSSSRKHSIHDPRMYAAISFGDAGYTKTLPADVTVSAGIDVLAHCTESYFSKKANEISRAFSVRGISLLAAPLLAAAEGKVPDDADRQALYEASILGGLAICITGTVFPHNVGYYLTETYHIPHGTACAVFLPELLDHANQCCAEYAADFYRRIGIEESAFRHIIVKSLPELGIRMSEREIDSALPRWENNSSVKNTVGQVTADDIKTILKVKFA